MNCLDDFSFTPFICLDSSVNNNEKVYETKVSKCLSESKTSYSLRLIKQCNKEKEYWIAAADLALILGVSVTQLTCKFHRKRPSPFGWCISFHDIIESHLKNSSPSFVQKLQASLDSL